VSGWGLSAKFGKVEMADVRREWGRIGFCQVIRAQFGRARFGRGWIVCAVSAGLVVFSSAAGLKAASPRERVFTIGNYPVDATAKSAVKAKRAAIAMGRQRAFGALLKRLIPVTAYNRIKELKTIDALPFLASVGVRSEERLPTRYSAGLDYEFSPKAVREMLLQHSVPFVEVAAPQTTVVVVYAAPQGYSGRLPQNMAQQKGQKLWKSVWADLDIKNALAPVKLAVRLAQIHPDAMANLAKGDFSSLRIFTGEYQSERVVLALARPDPQTARLNVVFSGQDAVGTFYMRRSYRIFDGDVAYSLELAAVIGLGVLEGRWKARKVQRFSGGKAGGRGGNFATSQPVQLWVTFHSLDQWQSIRKIITETPGVTNLVVGGLTAQGATVALKYRGGGNGLKAALASRGLNLESRNGSWILR